MAVAAMAVIAASCAKTEMGGNISSGISKGETVQKEIVSDKAPAPRYLPGMAVVRFSEAAVARIENGSENFSELRRELGVTVMERLFPDAGEFEERTRRAGLHKYYVVEFDPQVSLDVAEKAFSAIEGMERFERQMRVKQLSFNDQYYGNLWAFNNAKTSIRVEEAWEYTTGKPEVKVCVVDGGIEQTHPDLQWNLATKENYNFCKKNTTITGEEHGTHVAGTIAAVSNNGIGVAGIAGGDYAKKQRGITLISAQVFQGSQSASSYEFAKAIKWGADNGAVISQNSWGYDFDYNDDGRLSEDEKRAALSATIDDYQKDAVDYFIKFAGCDNAGEQLQGSPMKGGIVCFAAGNDGIENGAPANYAPIIAVGAVEKSGSVTSFSNYGDWVDICAPGQSITSCILNGKYGTMDGTSMACPHVSGVAALIVSYFGRQGFTNKDLEEFLLKGANPSLILAGSHHVGPYLDAYGSIQYGIIKYRRDTNQAPVIKMEREGDLTLHQWENVSIPIIIKDPDGDALDIKTEIEGRAQLRKDNDTTYTFSLLCELVNDFTPKKVRITASDMFDETAVLEFQYTVLKNNAPKAVGKVDDRIIYGTGRSFDIDLAGIFTDEDGEELTYSAKVTPQTAASAKAEGSRITITPATYGNMKVAFIAGDYMGEKAETVANILVRQEGREVDFYPNPVKDVLHVRTGQDKASASITISSSMGKVLLHKDVNCSAFEPADIDMSDFAPGEYKLTAENEGKTFNFVIAKI